MRKEKVSIGKIDASREREFLRKYNLIGGIEQELSEVTLVELVGCEDVEARSQ